MTKLPETQQPQPSTILQIIERAVSNPDIDIAKMERLFSLYDEIEKKSTNKEFVYAMSAAQSEMGRVAADAKNQQTRSVYATYAALDRAIRSIYTAHGFSLTFDTEEIPGDMIRLICDVSHTGGYTRRYKIDLCADGKGAKGNDVMTRTHATGSAITYGKRYLLLMIWNIAIGQDDDGNASSDTATLVTNEQISEILGLIETTGVEVGKICSWLRIDDLNEMKSSDFQRVKNALLEKLK